MLSLFKVFMSDNVDKDLSPIIKSGYVAQGPQVELFEQKLKDYFKYPHILTLNSATSGLTLAIRLLNLSPGDEVISTPLTCLYYESPVLLENGTIVSIGEIVNKQIKCKVMSYNLITETFQAKKVINWIKQPIGSKIWYHLSHRYAPGSPSPVGIQGVYLTNDHNVLTDKGYVPVEKLDISAHKIATYTQRPNCRQQEMIDGNLLGNGYIRQKGRGNACFSLTNNFDQKELMSIVERGLAGLNPYVYSRKDYKQNKETLILQTSNSPYWSELHQKWYPDVKRVPRDLHYTPRMLAIWYMNYGNLTQNAALLCTDYFPEEDILFLQGLFGDIGINCTHFTEKRSEKESICLHIGNDSNNSVHKFFEMIAPYIHESFKYKFPEKYHGKYNPDLWDIGSSELYYSTPIITLINPPKKRYCSNVYCIEVEDNHNFVSCGIVLKNCTATNWPILANGLKVKWADVDSNTCNISIDSIREKLSEKTKAIMVVHWGGYPVDLDALKNVQDEAEKRFGFRPPIIEDCAHAFGAKYKGKIIGTYGNICVFSLQAIKHLTTGDGGLIFLPNKELYDRAKLLRWFGIDREKRSNGGDIRLEADISEWGHKYHMNDINACIGISNLPHVAKNLEQLHIVAKEYRERLQKLSPEVELMEEKEGFVSARWIFTIKIVNKKGFIDFMTKKGIMVSQVHNRNDIHSCVIESRTPLPILDRLEKEIICIPAGWWLSRGERELILFSVEEWCRQNKLSFRPLKFEDYKKGYLQLLGQMNGFDYTKTCNTQEKFNDAVVQTLIANGKVIVGEINGNLVCSGKLQIEHKFGACVAHIEDIVVAESSRHSGVGKKLVQYLTELAQEYKPYKIVLMCKETLSSFYIKCGYQQNGLQFNKYL